MQNWLAYGVQGAFAMLALSTAPQSDLVALSETIADELAAVEHTGNNVDGSRFTKRALDAKVNCTTFKILVQATPSGKKLLYDIPVSKVRIDYKNDRWEGPSANLIFQCINMSACILESSVDGGINFDGLPVARATMAGFGVRDAEILAINLRHLQAYQTVCRSMGARK